MLRNSIQVYSVPHLSFHYNSDRTPGEPFIDMREWSDSEEIRKLDQIAHESEGFLKGLMSRRDELNTEGAFGAVMKRLDAIKPPFSTPEGAFALRFWNAQQNVEDRLIEALGHDSDMEGKHSPLRSVIEAAVKPRTLNEMLGLLQVGELPDDHLRTVINDAVTTEQKADLLNAAKATPSQTKGRS